MNWTDFFYGLEDLFEAFFPLIEALGNFPNIVFLMLTFVAMIIWLRMQAKFNMEAEEKGALK